MSYIELISWKTPSSGWKEETYKSVRITKVEYKGRRVYEMNSVYGYPCYHLLTDSTITMLQKVEGEKWKDVMTDEPRDFLGMQEIASLCYGNVIVAGLGMGIILYHLQYNNKVNKVTVVEIDKDVIEFIKPKIDRVVKLEYEVVEQDFMEKNKEIKDEYNCVVIDILATETQRDYAEGEELYRKIKEKMKDKVPNLLFKGYKQLWRS